VFELTVAQEIESSLLKEFISAGDLSVKSTILFGPGEMFNERINTALFIQHYFIYGILLFFLHP